MSSQGNTGIPLTHAPDGKGYKLLELPPELLALLESDDPPVSSPPPVSAVIKHGGQTWGLRQKNTSNALILLAPAPASSSSSSGDASDPAAQPGATELKVISTIHESVELLLDTTGETAKPVARGKWHEKFARTR
ncbi:hypothetical protein PG993_003346 [Apiospora rasikravindrae]|uniref:Sister chromatid cohesion protein DCC1 n=1 Tax=Apiospora rasikravindrae TaxID=990691 RepID=A0ABR1TZ89_9PEZI